jgi:hypothetical protein
MKLFFFSIYLIHPLAIPCGRRPPFRPSQGTWARSNVEKAHAFAEHLANVFQPHLSENEPEGEEEEALMQLLVTPYQLEQPINRPIRAEFQEVINSLNPKKSSGYDLIASGSGTLQ